MAERIIAHQCAWPPCYSRATIAPPGRASCSGFSNARDQALRLETRYDNETSEQVLIIYDLDGTEAADQFADTKAAYRMTLVALEAVQKSNTGLSKIATFLPRYGLPQRVLTHPGVGQR